MKRREFVGLVAGAAAWPLGARAQQGGGLRRFGVLAGYAANDPLGQMLATILLQGLAALGWSEVKTSILTGVGRAATPSCYGKWVELLKQIKPTIASVALLYNPASTPFADLILQAVEPAARSFAVTARSSECRDDADVNALMKLARDKRGGVLVMPEVFTTAHRDAIVAAAARHRVPAVYPGEISTTHGELMSYGIDPADVFRRSASYVDCILKGKTPATCRCRIRPNSG